MELTFAGVVLIATSVLVTLPSPRLFAAKPCYYYMVLATFSTSSRSSGSIFWTPVLVSLFVSQLSP